MAKYYGKVGYAETIKTAPGVYTDRTTIVERPYSGDYVRNMSSRNTPSGDVNDDIVIENAISIVADPYAYEHFHNIKYVTSMGAKWKVTSVEIQHPRLILTTGGIYNE